MTVGSNLGTVTGYHSVHAQRKYLVSTENDVKTAYFHLVSNSLLANDPTIRHYVT
jgi:hypothetical protein